MNVSLKNSVPVRLKIQKAADYKIRVYPPAIYPDFYCFPVFFSFVYYCQGVFLIEQADAPLRMSRSFQKQYFPVSKLEIAFGGQL